MCSFRYVPQIATDQRIEIYSRDEKKIDSKVFTARVSPCPRVLRLWRRRGSSHVEPLNHSPDANEMKRWLVTRFSSLQTAPPEARQE